MSPRGWDDPQEIYSPESTDGRTRWAAWRETGLMVGAVIAGSAIVVWAIWSVLTHLWIVPIILLPLIIWAIMSEVRSS